MRDDQAERIVRDFLKYYPLYSRDQHVHALRIENGQLVIGWTADGRATHDRTTYFDMHKIEGRLYLLHIEINEAHRGKGLGEMLYRIVEDIGIELGCDEIWQTPSGRTTTGESRMDYVVRKLGYSANGIEATKSLRGPDA